MSGLQLTAGTDEGYDGFAGERLGQLLELPMGLGHKQNPAAPWAVPWGVWLPSPGWLNSGLHVLLCPAPALQKPLSSPPPCTKGVSALGAGFTSRGQGGPFQAASQGPWLLATSTPECRHLPASIWAGALSLVNVPAQRQQKLGPKGQKLRLQF